MSEFLGTPGPWEVMSEDGELKVIQAGSVEHGYGWKSYCDVCSEVSMSQNARLIAAAPELLEALQEAEKALFAALDNAFGEELANENREVIQARAAIAKALGK